MASKKYTGHFKHRHFNQNIRNTHRYFLVCLSWKRMFQGEICLIISIIIKIISIENIAKTKGDTLI